MRNYGGSDNLSQVNDKYHFLVNISKTLRPIELKKKFSNSLKNLFKIILKPNENSHMQQRYSQVEAPVGSVPPN